MIVFKNMSVDMLCNKKRQPIVTELFLRDKKVKASAAFVNFLTNHFFLRKKFSTFQTNESFNKLQLVIHQIMTLKTLLILTKM